MSLRTRKALLKRDVSPAASVVNEGQASPAAAVVAKDSEDEDENWNVKDAPDLDYAERAGAKRCLHYLYESYRSKKRGSRNRCGSVEAVYRVGEPGGSFRRGSIV